MATISVSLPSDGQTIDASDYNTPINTIVSEFNGNIDNANIKTAAAISGSKIADASIDLGAKGSVFDGWIPVSDSWAYASATTITVPSDATTKYAVGDKIKLVQSAATKYFYITAVSSTVLTVTGGSDYTVANSAISGIYYSKAATPQGFPQWFNYSPTFANITAGNGTTSARFRMNAKDVVVKFKFTMGSTSSMGTGPTFTLPVTAASGYGSEDIYGSAVIRDAGTNTFGAFAHCSSTTVAIVRYANAASTPVISTSITSTAPMTWTTGDFIDATLLYEAA